MRVSVPEFSVDKTETSPVSGEGSVGQLPFRYYGSPDRDPLPHSKLWKRWEGALLTCRRCTLNVSFVKEAR